MSDLAAKRCKPCEGGTRPLDLDSARSLLEGIDHWTLDASGKEIRKPFSFPDFHRTMAFVNAVAWISHREDHHPDLEVGYNHCTIRYSTHSIGGLSENDFICAAKVDRLLASG